MLSNRDILAIVGLMFLSFFVWGLEFCIFFSPIMILLLWIVILLKKEKTEIKG